VGLISSADATVDTTRNSSKAATNVRKRVAMWDSSECRELTAVSGLKQVAFDPLHLIRESTLQHICVNRGVFQQGIRERIGPGTESLLVRPVEAIGD
jgi:hypothetical protein